MSLSGSEGNLHDTGSPISEELFFGFCFGGVALSFPFLAFRLFVRWKLFRKLFWDDILVIFAWIISLSTVVATWITRDGLYMIHYLFEGVKPWTEHNFMLAVGQLRLYVAALLLFTTSLWLIKLSFLIFFRRLGGIESSQRSWWWFVTIFTVLTYFTIFGIVPYSCTSSNLAVLLEKCNSAEDKYRRYCLFYYHLAADIASDAMIISIPVIMLRNVQLPRKQKLGLMGLFSLTMVVIVFAIIRLVVNVSDNASKQDAAWLGFWAYLELTVAIIVACCGSFRQLFKKSGQSNGSSSRSIPRTRPNQDYKLRSMLCGWRKGLRRSNTSDDFSLIPNYNAAALHDKYEAEERMEHASNKHIIVSREVEITKVHIPLKQVDRAHVADHSRTAPRWCENAI